MKPATFADPMIKKKESTS